MFSFAKERQSVGEVLVDSFNLYCSTLLKILPLSALIMLVGAISSLLQFLNITPAIDLNNMQKLMHTTDTFTLMGVGLLFTATALLAVFLIGVLIHGMYALALGQQPVWMDSARVIMTKLVAVFSAFILSTALMVLGFMLFFFPGIFISVMLMFYMPFVILDNHGGLTAIEKSWRLVWGNWWVTFFVMLVPVLISIFLMALMVTVAKQNELLLILMNFAVMSFFTPFFYAVMLVQFNNLKLERPAKPVE